jgi:hypothetical protein
MAATRRRASLRIFLKACISIWRTRSREIPNSRQLRDLHRLPLSRPPTVKMPRVLSAVAVPLSCLHTRAARDGKRRPASVAKMSARPPLPPIVTEWWPLVEASPRAPVDPRYTQR